MSPQEREDVRGASAPGVRKKEGPQDGQDDKGYAENRKIKPISLIFLYFGAFIGCRFAFFAIGPPVFLSVGRVGW